VTLILAGVYARQSLVSLARLSRHRSQQHRDQKDNFLWEATPCDADGFWQTDFGHGPPVHSIEGNGELRRAGLYIRGRLDWRWSSDSEIIFLV
jgi:hypothetical protein